ncbi:MAG: GNAT family N-acetyltransferase [Anaerolineae bacterium]
MPGTLFDFGEFPVLETERLMLREITLKDTAAVFAIRGDYEVTKYNIGAAYLDMAQASSLIVSIKGDYLHKRAVRWGMVLKDTGEFVGMCGYNYWNQQDFRASIGYDLLRSQWGKGLMPETLRAVIAFGFQQMNLNRIEADTSLNNIASVRVLQKLGFRQEGRQREQYFENGRFYDLLLFSLLRREHV